MDRFLLRPKWIAFHLLVLAAVIAMINLGLWQLRRLDERRDFNSAVTERLGQSPVPLADLLAGATDPAELEWRPVTVAGSYLAGADIVIVNRSQDGVAGQDVVTPLRTAQGTIVLVNRGFTPLEVAAPPAPSGEVSVEGHVRRSQHRRFGQLSDPSEGPLDVAQRVDIERLRAQLPGDVAPVYVDLVRSSPAEPADLRPVALPELTERNHLSYAVQWFTFSAAAVVGWALAVRRSRRAARAERLADVSARPPDDPAHAAADASTTAPR